MTQKKRYIKIGCRGPILLFHRWFGTRILSPIQLATLHFTDTLSESEMAQIFKFSFDNESIQSSVLAFLSPFRFWKGICKVASWIGLEILVPNHPWKSKIGPLQPILAAKCYVSFFWVTLYQYHIKITFWPFSLQEGKKWSALADSRIFVNLNQLNGHFLVLTFATIAILLNTLVSTFGGVPLSLICDFWAVEQWR